MSKLSFAEYVASKKVTTFSFVNFTKSPTNPRLDGNGKILEEASYELVFELETPIEEIKGSQTIYSEEDDKAIPITAFDVETVRVHAKFVEKYPNDFDYEEQADGRVSGTYSGNGILDVTKEHQDVLLVDTKLSAFAWSQRTQAKQSRNAAIISRLRKK